LVKILELILVVVRMVSKCLALPLCSLVLHLSWGSLSLLDR